MIQSLIVLALVAVALLFWLNRLFPAHATRLKRQLGITKKTAQIDAKKGCGSCSGCKGGGCH